MHLPVVDVALRASARHRVVRARRHRRRRRRHAVVEAERSDRACPAPGLAMKYSPLAGTRKSSMTSAELAVVVPDARPTGSARSRTRTPNEVLVDVLALQVRIDRLGSMPPSSAFLPGVPLIGVVLAGSGAEVVGLRLQLTAERADVDVGRDVLVVTAVVGEDLALAVVHRIPGEADARGAQFFFRSMTVLPKRSPRLLPLPADAAFDREVRQHPPGVLRVDRRVVVDRLGRRAAARSVQVAESVRREAGRPDRSRSSGAGSRSCPCRWPELRLVMRLAGAAGKAIVQRIDLHVVDAALDRVTAEIARQVRADSRRA